MAQIEIDGLYFNSPYDEVMRYKRYEKAKIIINIWVDTARAIIDHPVIAPALYDIGCIQAATVAAQPIMPSRFVSGEIVHVSNNDVVNPIMDNLTDRKEVRS